MKTLLDRATEGDTRFRLRQLQATTPIRWGKTTPARIAVHLTDVFGQPLAPPGATPDPGLLAKSPRLRRLHAMSLPCPDRAALVVTEDLPPDLNAWKGQLQACQDAFGRCLARLRTPGGAPLSPHPAYGPIPAEEWGELLYLHVDHHLRQFGV